MCGLGRIGAGLFVDVVEIEDGWVVNKPDEGLDCSGSSAGKGGFEELGIESWCCLWPFVPALHQRQFELPLRDSPDFEPLVSAPHLI
jgi:hypothetical protein